MQAWSGSFLRQPEGEPGFFSGPENESVAKWTTALAPALCAAARCGRVPLSPSTLFASAPALVSA